MTTIIETTDIQASPTTVYRALATESGIRGWWSRDCDVSEQVDGHNELRFDKAGRQVTMRFTIAELTPKERVRWRCTENGNPVWIDTTLSWAISAVGEHSRVELRHEGFRESESPPYRMTVEGWPPFMRSLKAYCETGSGQPI